MDRAAARAAPGGPVPQEVPGFEEARQLPHQFSGLDGLRDRLSRNFRKALPRGLHTLPSCQQSQADIAQLVVGISAQTWRDCAQHRADFIPAPTGQTQRIPKRICKVEDVRDCRNICGKPVYRQRFTNEEVFVDRCQVISHVLQDGQVAIWVGRAMVRMCLKQLLDLPFRQHRIGPDPGFGVPPLPFQRIGIDFAHCALGIRCRHALFSFPISFDRLGELRE